MEEKLMCAQALHKSQLDAAEMLYKADEDLRRYSEDVEDSRERKRKNVKALKALLNQMPSACKQAILPISEYGKVVIATRTPGDWELQLVDIKS